MKVIMRIPKKTPPPGRTVHGRPIDHRQALLAPAVRPPMHSDGAAKSWVDPATDKTYDVIRQIATALKLDLTKKGKKKKKKK